MEQIDIQLVTSNGLEQLQQIARQTFLETYSPHNTAENMNKYLEEKFSIPILASELRNPDSQFYFATQNDHIVGYLKINTGNSQTELKHKDALEIERIYVLQKFHGKNVGLLLLEKAIQLAQESKSPHVWLGVWEKNPRAIRFYSKNGFAEFDTHIFKLGSEEQTDIMMKKILKP